jgi:Pentapeptide repeats (8 copies)
MANDEHVALLKQGVDAWNAWRDENPNIRPDLREENLRWAYLRRANLRRADLWQAGLRGANLSRADLRGANLRGANLRRANLRRANLEEAKLRRADLRGADLTRADLRDALLSRAHLLNVNLTEADLRGASLEAATLVDTDFTGADLTGCHVYGLSAWNLKLKGTKQQDLVITKDDESTVTVDNIEVAQFVYLLPHNEKIRDVIDTIGKKAVLILGRFTPEQVTCALRDPAPPAWALVVPRDGAINRNGGSRCQRLRRSD